MTSGADKGRDFHGELEVAIRNYVNAMTGDGYLTDWFMYAAYADPEDPDAYGYRYALRSGTPLHSIIGLTKAAAKKIPKSYINKEDADNEWDDDE